MKKHLYQRIVERTDNKKPSTLKEFWELHGDNLGDCFIMELKLLTNNSGKIRLQWSEKMADSDV